MQPKTNIIVLQTKAMEQNITAFESNTSIEAKADEMQALQHLINEDLFLIRKLMLQLSVAETRLAEHINEKKKLAREMLEEV